MFIQNPKIEIIICWKDCVLEAKYIDENDKFLVGETKLCNYYISSDFLPSKEFELINKGILYSPDVDYVLTKYFTEIDLGPLTIKARLVEAETKPSLPLITDFSKFTYFGASAISHIALLCIIAFFVPPMGIVDAEESHRNNLFLINQYLQASAERELEAKESQNVATEKADDKEGGTGTRAKGEEGVMGTPNSRVLNKRFGIAGPADNKDIHIARDNALHDASTFGLLGILNSATYGSNAPTAPWGRDEALGNDPIDARGNMWGAEIGEAFGSNGLGLSGIGDAGGGKGEGIGLGPLGTIGRGAGLGDNQGFGNGHGRFMNNGHKVKSFQMRTGTTSITGRLPAEVIQRIVRQNFGRFRSCFDIGLRNNPNLQGRVAVRFIIGRDGSVSNVGNSGSDLPDSAVISCVVRSFYGLSFPEPENGIVTVVYPIMFMSQN